MKHQKSLYCVDDSSAQIRTLKCFPTLSKCVLRDDIQGESSIYALEIEDLSCFGTVEHLFLEQRNFVLYDRFNFSDPLLGKIRCKGASAHAMPVVGDSAKQAILIVGQRLSSKYAGCFVCLTAFVLAVKLSPQRIHHHHTWQPSQFAGKWCPALGPKEEWRLFSASVSRRIHLAVVILIVDLDLVGSYPDDRTILFVQLGCLPEKTARMGPQIVVRLVPIGDRRKLRAWDVRDGVEVDSVNGQYCGIRKCCHCQEHQKRHFFEEEVEVSDCSVNRRNMAGI